MLVDGGRLAGRHASADAARWTEWLGCRPRLGSRHAAYLARKQSNSVIVKRAASAAQPQSIAAYASVGMTSQPFLLGMPPAIVDPQLKLEVHGNEHDPTKWLAAACQARNRPWSRRSLGSLLSPRRRGGSRAGRNPVVCRFGRAYRG